MRATGSLLQALPLTGYMRAKGRLLQALPLTG
jgi:hypothetical protein